MSINSEVFLATMFSYKFIITDLRKPQLYVGDARTSRRRTQDQMVLGFEPEWSCKARSQGFHICPSFRENSVRKSGEGVITVFKKLWQSLEI